MGFLDPIERASLVLFTLTSCLFGQAFPDAAGLIGRSEAALKTPNVEVVSEMTTEVGSMSNPFKMQMNMTMWSGPSGAMRMESDGIAKMLIISDGETVWNYTPGSLQYTKTKVPAQGKSLSANPMLPFPAGKSIVTGVEAVKLGDELRECWILETDMDGLLPATAKAALEVGKLTQWIDKQSGFTLRTMVVSKMTAIAGQGTSMKVEMVVKSIKMDRKYAAGFFTFTPPEGAKEVSALGVPTGIRVKEAEVAPKPRSPRPDKVEAFVPDLQPLQPIRPEYPEEAKTDPVTEMVRLFLTISETGIVEKAEVGLGSAVFHANALKAARTARFRPVLRNGKPVKAITTATVFLFSPEPSKSKIGRPTTDKYTEYFNREEELRKEFPRSLKQILADLENDRIGSDVETQLSTFGGVIQAALDADLVEKAEQYGREFLVLAKATRESYSYKQNLHDANMCLGLVAVHKKDIPLAKTFLRRSMDDAAQADGRVNIRTDLAQTLLEAGEQDAVLLYLKQGRESWNPPPKLEDWIKAIEAGGKPELR